MNKHIKRLPLYIIVGAVAIFLMVWGSALIKCEILTNKYYDEFKCAYQSNSMISDIEYFKILNCDDATAEVYYVSKGSGNVLKFENQNGTWTQTEWKTVWSKSGSASDAVWPYWWQFFITGA